MEDVVRQNLPMILIRVIVGLVFLLEGILKLVRPEEMGAGRFAAIGLPFPQVLAPLVGGVEIGGAAAILELLCRRCRARAARGHPHCPHRHKVSRPAGQAPGAIRASQAHELRLAELFPRGAH
jgi:hypothetical protein